MQAKRISFSEKRCLGEMKNSKIEIIYGDPKMLLSFKKAGNLASNQPNFKAATSICSKKFITSKLEPIKFWIKVILCKDTVELDRREQ